jgi:hypothetical protein
MAKPAVLIERKQYANWSISMLRRTIENMRNEVAWCKATGSSELMAIHCSCLGVARAALIARKSKDQ